MKGRLLALLLLAIAGCAPALGATPRSTLRAYGDAIADGRADDAYKMLSTDAQRAIPLATFREMVAKNRAEAMELGKALARDPGDPYVTAVVPLPDGDVVLLVYEEGRWRVDGGALEFYSQATPRQAILGFVKAVSRNRWDVLLKYTPDAHREGLTADRLAAAWNEKTEDGKKLRDAIVRIREGLPSAKFEETGDRAVMVYGNENATVLFVREHGSWKIEDIPIHY